MGEQKLIWERNYTNLRVVQRRGEYFPFYKVWENGDKERELSVVLNNVTFTQNTITIFEVKGNIFAGKDSKLNLKIYKQDNGVVRGEIRVV